MTPSWQRRFQCFLEFGNWEGESGNGTGRAPSDTKPAQMVPSFQVWNSETSKVIRERGNDLVYAVLLEAPTWQRRFQACWPSSRTDHSLSEFRQILPAGPHLSHCQPGPLHGGLAPTKQPRAWGRFLSRSHPSRHQPRPLHGGTTSSNGRGRAEPD
jgi:hypothetical protein